MVLAAFAVVILLTQPARIDRLDEARVGDSHMNGAAPARPAGKLQGSLTAAHQAERVKLGPLSAVTDAGGDSDLR